MNVCIAKTYYIVNLINAHNNKNTLHKIHTFIRNCIIKKDIKDLWLKVNHFVVDKGCYIYIYSRLSQNESTAALYTRVGTARGTMGWCMVNIYVYVSVGEFV